MTTRHSFTDDEIWTILVAPESESGGALARRLGCNEQSVRVLRARLRRYGWACTVAYRECRCCGRMFTGRGVKAGWAAYHPECHKVALEESGQRNERDRWDRLAEAERLATLDRAHLHVKTKRAETRITAVNHHTRLSDDDDAQLLADDALPHHAHNERLGRSLYAVKAQDRLLRPRQKPS